MTGATLAVSTLVGSPSPMQAVGLSAIVDAPGPTRAVVAFVGVLAAGGLLLWRVDPFVDRAIETSMARPLSSLAYGVAANAVIAFGAVYLTNQLAQLEAFGQSVGVVGVLAGLIVVLLAGALGLTVVGATAVELAWYRSHRAGLLLGAVVAGVAGLLEPLVGGLLLFVLVSMGIGGPARAWLHADEVEAVAEAR